MKYQFIYWLCLAFIFNISIASEKQFLHLSNQSTEQNTSRAYVRVTQQDHSSIRQIAYSSLNPYDYVYAQTPDGQVWSVRKAQISNYQPQFELGMLNEYVAPSRGRRWFDMDRVYNTLLINLLAILLKMFFTVLGELPYLKPLKDSKKFV